MAGTLTISGMSSGENAGQRTFGPLTITGTTIIGETLAVSLASGDNTFTVPTGAVAALIIAPTSGAVVLKLRTNTNSGDAGLVLPSASLPVVYAFPATAPTSLIVNAASAQAAPLTIVFI